MQSLLVKIDSVIAFNECKRIVSAHFDNETDWHFLSLYFIQDGNWRPLSFTHLGITEDGAVFPTTAEKIAPRTAVCTVDLLSEYIKCFGEGDLSIKNADTYDLVEKYSKTKDKDEALKIKQRLIAAIEYENTANVAKEIITLVLYLLGNNGEGLDMPYFEQRASAICLLASHERELFEPFPTSLDPVPTNEIYKLVNEYVTTEDFCRSNSIHVKLNDMIRANNKDGDVERAKENWVGNMIVKSGNRRKNAPHYAPIINLIITGNLN